MQVLRAVGIGAALLAGCGRVAFDPVPDGGVDPLAVTLTPATATINVASELSLTAGSGVPPYTFTTDTGDIDATGRFFAPERAGIATVTVEDAAGSQASATVRYEGDRLFLLGGQLSSGASDRVLSSPDGATWTDVGQLPAPRESGAAFVFDDLMYYVGGDAGAVTPPDEVWTSTDGATWRLGSRLPRAWMSFAVVIHQRGIWILGGYSGTNEAAIYRSADGVTWTADGELPTGRHEVDAFSRADSILLVGGHDDGGLLTTVTVRDGAGGFTTKGTLAFAVDFASSAEVGAQVFHGGGTGSLGVERSFDFLSWTPCTSLPGTPFDGPAMLGFRGQLLVIGNGAVHSSPDCASWATTGTGTVPSVQRTDAVQFTPR